MKNQILDIIPQHMIPHTFIICDGGDYYVIDDAERVKSLEQLSGDILNRGLNNDDVVDILMQHIDREFDHVDQWRQRDNSFHND